MREKTQQLKSTMLNRRGVQGLGDSEDLVRDEMITTITQGVVVLVAASLGTPAGCAEKFAGLLKVPSSRDMKHRVESACALFSLIRRKTNKLVQKADHRGAFLQFAGAVSFPDGIGLDKQ
ncbi:hypothetical protein SCA6_004888 [Theobroma cacao]